MQSKPIAVVVADAHVHPFGAHNTYDAEGLSSRVDRTVKALYESLEYAATHECAWISAGDLLHTKGHIPYEVVDPICRMMHRYGEVDKYLLVGNHERPDRFTETDILGWIPDVRVIKCFGRYPIGDSMFAFVPWYDEHQRIIDGFKMAQQYGADVVIAHAAINNAKMDNGMPYSGSLSTDDLGTFAFPRVLFGDFHKRQDVLDNVHYVGALVQQNYGERDNPQGFAVVWSDHRVTWVDVDVPSFAYTYDEEDVGAFTKMHPTAVMAEAREVEANLVVDTGNVHDFAALLDAYLIENPPPEGVDKTSVIELATQFMEATSNE